MARRRLWWRHLLSVLLAPATMTVFIPVSIGALTGLRAPDLGSVSGALLAVVGGLAIAFGMFMLTWTVVLFDRVGEGTLAIGSPVKLVVTGPYRHVRNPMMTGVFCIQIGAALAWASPWLLAWFAVFFTAVLIAIRAVEEPHLRRRFGEQYDEYRRHVPRWIPRVSAWEPSPTSDAPVRNGGGSAAKRG
ncbi:methyltransferase family protein [Mycobacterium deserti]|uniref:Isoprenylcysteine carboxylmethyltransferase family protein n=1 Tax=Mycobacterium deserti TaxID=2978347 RepID=A0ABT2MH36_9MYCO|nr:isoprenylcysteine carboxylmethyltransferase family protein [Mycobacterium deserti]MCT7661604.1 isoprenylcysteine carboxylmethyltransferase family protein [Mycobacterium deserti]